MNESTPAAPLEKLKTAISGRPVVPSAYASVSKDDVLSVCDLCGSEKDERLEAIRAGSKKASGKVLVNLAVPDLAFLVEMAESECRTTG